MTEAITTVRALTNAQEVYFMKNGTYTTNLADLDVSTPKSDYYTYACDQQTCYGHTTTSLSLPVVEFYMQYAQNSISLGKHFCIAAPYNEINRAICSSLGDRDTTRDSRYFLLK